VPCTFSTKHDHNLLSLYTRRWHSDTPGEQRNRFRPAEGASDAQKDGGLLVLLPSPSGTLERFSKFPKALCGSLYLCTPRNFWLLNSGWGHFLRTPVALLAAQICACGGQKYKHNQKHIFLYNCRCFGRKSSKQRRTSSCWKFLEMCVSHSQT